MSAPRPLLRKPTPLDDVLGVHGIVLDRLLQKELGAGYLSWDGDPLHAELVDRWGSVGQVAWERIQAMRLLRANDLFWREWGAFEKVTAALAGEIPDFAAVQPPEAEDIIIALHTAAYVRELPFSSDVRGYIAAACVNDGVWYLEPPLDVAEEALDYLLKSREISLPKEEVKHLLSTRKASISPETSAADAQFNVILAVRANVADFWREVDEQTKLYVTGGTGG